MLATLEGLAIVIFDEDPTAQLAFEDAVIGATFSLFATSAAVEDRVFLV